MTADKRISLIRVKVERAKKHFGEVEIARDTFLSTEPYGFESKINPQTGYEDFYITRIQDPPVEIGLVAGDVIHNLRSALDHLAWQLVLANGQTPSVSTCFPIFDSAERFQTMDARKVRGMSQSAIDAIGATKPYKDGADALWCLHKLDIADKHHALLTAIISVVEASLTSFGSFTQPGFRFGGFSLPNFQSPLKIGDVFFTREPGMHREVKLNFDVAFNEEGILEGKPVLRTLQYLIDQVEKLILDFKPLLS